MNDMEVKFGLIAVGDAREPLRALLYNVEKYPLPIFHDWLKIQLPNVRSCAMSYPPNRIYQHDDGRVCWIVGYHRSGEPLVAFLGGEEAMGVLVASVNLQDVTDTVRGLLGLTP